MAAWWSIDGDPRVDLTSVQEALLVRLAERYEQDWNEGRFVGTPPGTGIGPEVDPDLRRLCLAELSAIDLERRLKRGECLQVETYLDLFPELADSPWAVLLLARAEVAGRVAPPGSATPSPIEEGTTTSHRFHLVELHDRGGQSHVHVAMDHGLERQVALKHLAPSQAASQTAVARFLNEARITARLEHPGIAPVHATGQLPDGLPFFVSRLIRGQTLEAAIEALQRELRSRRFSLARDRNFRLLLRRFLTVCRTAAFAHSQGYIHRDIKPSNIVFGDFDETILLDWGLAASLGIEERAANPADPAPPTVDRMRPGDLTAPGMIVGTPVYASPEQFAGDPTRVGVPSDIYNLGATLYHLLTGRPPLRTDDSLDELRRKVTAGEVPSPRSVARSIPRDLDAICLKAMSRAPEKRYATAEALAEDLLAWLDDDPVTARREPWWRKATRWMRRHPSATAVVGVLAIAGLGLGGTLVVSAEFRHQATRKAVEDLGRVTLAGVPELTGRLRTDRDLAIGQVNAFLDQPDLSESQRRIVALVRLGLEPRETTQVRQDLAASQPWATSVVDALMARPPVDVGQADALRKQLRPVRDDLLPELRAVLRKLNGPHSAEALEMAGKPVLEYLDDRPEQLARFLPDLPEPLFPQAVARLRLAPLDRVLPALHAALDETLQGWPEQPPDPAWGQPAPDAVRAIEHASGWVGPHFALCQTLELERWPGLVEALRPAGYRPFRVRPYQQADGTFRVAGLWARDGIESVITVDQDEESMRTADQAHRERGLSLVDVAGYAPGESGPTRYLAVWSVPASSIQEVWRRKTEFAFQLGRQAWPAHFPVVNFELGLKPEEARTRELRDWPRPDWVPWTVQLTATPAGSPRMTRSWALILGMDTALPPTFEPRAAYEDRLFHGLLQLDVSVAFERSTVAVGDNWYGATWLSPTSLESQELHEVDPDRHLAEAKRLTSDGYRPVALAVATGPDGAVAASVWHRPADVSEQLAVAPERTLRIAAALHHLGDKEVLWNLCRRSPDSTARFLLADRASDLGLSASELVEHLGHEEDPGVCQVLLLALGSYPAQDIRGSGIARIANQLERLETRTLDPGVHSAASWLRGRLERDGLLEPHRELNVDPPGSEGRLWTVDGQGHTLAVIAGPVEFVMGESRYYPADPDGVEARHRVRVPRSFALQTSEVSVGDFQAFLAATEGPSLSSTLRSRLYPDQPDVPVTGVGLLDIARYANWLSELEGVPRDQWCFVPDGNALRLAPDYLDRVGHRLPTEAEWEYVCRAGTTTARPFGRGLAKPDPLTARYAWHLMNATGRVHPVAHLWPNDLGLFDVLGNAREFCLNTQRAYCKGRCSQPELDVEEPGLALDRVLLVTRGGSVETPETGHFSSHRNACDSLNVPRDVGFRLARTIRRP